jgi:hypothetical protein
LVIASLATLRGFGDGGSGADVSEVGAPVGEVPGPAGEDDSTSVEPARDGDPGVLVVLLVQPASSVAADSTATAARLAPVMPV